MLAQPSKYSMVQQPWAQVITVDGVIAGLALVWKATAVHPHPAIEELFVDRWFQGRGVEAATVRQVEQWAVGEGATSIEASWVDGAGSQKWIFEGCGFEPTGKVAEATVYARKDLEPSLAD